MIKFFIHLIEKKIKMKIKINMVIMKKEKRMK